MIMWKDVSAAAKNPVYRPNTLFVTQEDLRSIRFVELQTRYPLAALVLGQRDEFQCILVLRHWLHERIVPDPNKPVTEDGDALRILAEGPKGGYYSCGPFSKALNAVLNAMGYVTRCVFAGAGEKEADLSGAHGVNEVWSNTYCKWILMDAEHDSHFEKEGKPLSGLEIRDEVLRDGAAHVVRVEGPERKPAAKEKDDSYGRTPRTYTWVSFYLEGNRHTIWPREIAADEVVLEDAYFKTHTWYRGGRKHWAYDARAFRPVRDRHVIEWTPNVLDINTRIEGDTAEVQISSCTPNLREYQVQLPGGNGKPVEAKFALPLKGIRTERFLRAVNLAGVCGPAYRLVIEQKE
jgi:hypothetical protein